MAPDQSGEYNNVEEPIDQQGQINDEMSTDYGQMGSDYGQMGTDYGQTGPDYGEMGADYTNSPFDKAQIDSGPEEPFGQDSMNESQFYESMPEKDLDINMSSNTPNSNISSSSEYGEYMPSETQNTNISPIVPGSNMSSPSQYQSPSEQPNTGGTRRRKGRKGRTKRKRNKKQ